MNADSRNPSDTGRGPPQSAEELLPKVYTELRRLAARRLTSERPGQTLQATALVHEAWLRLERDKNRQWNGRTHFFCAAAIAMRRILLENARRKNRRRDLEGGERLPLEGLQLSSPLPDEELLALDEALHELAAYHPKAEQLVELRFFAGLQQAQAAEHLGISRSTAARLWLLARSWLYARIRIPEQADMKRSDEQKL